ncbi:MAG: corrinoid protein [Deltaproteobacteria bacterium]|nr:corrinoid protein [Deltaproteobacteria bacterium]
MGEIIGRITQEVIKGDIVEVERLTREAIAEKKDVKRITNEGFIPGLDLVGEKFSAGEFFLPEMLVAAMAVKAGMEIIKPILSKGGDQSKGTIVAGAVLGDIHDIGKNLVCMMYEGAGFRVIDLGVDVAADKFIQAAITNKADIIAMSAIISTIRAGMGGIVRDIRASELESNLKIMVGGAAVTQEFADRIGADGYAPDANLAVKKAKEIMGIA